MRHSQRGVTLIGWLVLLVPIAIVVYGGIRLVPVYLNYMRVSKALSQTASEAKTGDTTNATTLRTAMDKHFDIEGIEKPTGKDIDIHREGEHWVMIADYEEVAPMFGNISLLVQFHKESQVE
jgi:hypothetical protein